MSIVRYLQSIGLKLDPDSPKIVSALSYIDTNVAAITQYMLYVHQQNYESVARPLISGLIPFPMQYRVPMQQRGIARQQCASMGLVAVGGSSEIEKKYPSLGKLQEQLEENKKQGMLHLRQAKESMKVLGYTHEVFDNIMALGAKDESGWAFIGKDGRWTSADLLLGAHLTIQTLQGFPVPIVKKLLNNEYPELSAFLIRLKAAFAKSEFEITETRSDDIPSLTNWVTSSIAELLGY